MDLSTARWLLGVVLGCSQHPCSVVSIPVTGAIWRHHVKISVQGATLVHLNFSSSVFHERQF